MTLNTGGSGLRKSVWVSKLGPMGPNRAWFPCSRPQRKVLKWLEIAVQFPGSSMVEHSAVNRRVASSNLARGANFSFFLNWLQTATSASSFFEVRLSRKCNACGFPYSRLFVVGSGAKFRWFIRFVKVRSSHELCLRRLGEVAFRHSASSSIHL